MLGQPQKAERCTPRSVSRVRIHTFLSRATASPIASGSSASRFSSFSLLRASSRKLANIIASRASSLARSASFAQSLISCSASNVIPGSSCLRGKEPTTGSFSHTGPERLPATKQVEAWIRAGRLMRLAKAITFCVPTTLVRRALSRVGLNVTLPALLMMTSMSSATR